MSWYLEYAKAPKLTTIYTLESHVLPWIAAPLKPSDGRITKFVYRNFLTEEQHSTFPKTASVSTTTDPVSD